MNYEEIINILKAQEDNDISDFAYGDFPEELGETEEVYSQGGEGKGEDWERVYFFKDHNIYLSFNGFYSSYNGTDFNGWDDCREVSPVERTVTFYE